MTIATAARRLIPSIHASAAAAVAVSLLAASVLSAIVGASEEPYDLWYVVEIDGARAGWLHERVEVGEDRITTTTDTSMSIRRGPSTVTIDIRSTFIETDRFEPLRWETSVAMGSEPIERVYTFGDGAVEIASAEGGRRSARSSDPPAGEWLTPAGVRAFTASRLSAGTGEISYRALDPMQQLSAVQTTLRDFRPATVDVLGRTVEAIRGEVISSATPGVSSTVFLDDAGRQLRTEVAIAGMSVVTLAADKELALGELDPPELMARTFVRTDRRIARPRRATDATYLLHVGDGELGEIPQTSSQRAERVDARSVRVHVRDGGGFAGGLASKENTEATLEASSMVNWKDPRIEELARRVGGEEGAPALRQAERLRQAVYRHINAKDLDVGFASASEVVRSRQGDCSEHAALLAALLRARGIPSRIASGLIYADGFLGERNIFGYHMWTQALVDVDGQERWVDLDATLGPSDAFDATHIALVVSTFSDDEGSNALVRLVPLLGRLRVEIESIE